MRSTFALPGACPVREATDLAGRSLDDEGTSTGPIRGPGPLQRSYVDPSGLARAPPPGGHERAAIDVSTPTTASTTISSMVVKPRRHPTHAFSFTTSPPVRTTGGGDTRKSQHACLRSRSSTAPGRRRCGRRHQTAACQSLKSHSTRTEVAGIHPRQPTSTPLSRHHSSPGPATISGSRETLFRPPASD